MATRNLDLLNSLPPLLYIGLGGVGGRMVRRIRDRIAADPDLGPYRMKCTSFLLVDTNPGDLTDHKNVDGIRTVLIGGRTRDDRAQMALNARDEFARGWWIPDDGTKPYVPRIPANGAGQIRIESRISSYLMADVLQRTVRSEMDRLFASSNAYINASSKRVSVYVFGSLTGGTGSGSFLNVACQVREALATSNLEASVFGHFLLSTAMSGTVDTELDDYIDANTAAALMEAEHLTAATYTDRSAVPFAWRRAQRPGEPPLMVARSTDTGPQRPNVMTQAPYDLIYLIEQPAENHLGTADHLVSAVADAAYFHVGVVSRQVEGPRDNYTRFMNTLGGTSPGMHDKGFTKHFGALGAAMLVCPTETLIEYCVDRAVGTLLQEQFASVQSKNAQAAEGFENELSALETHKRVRTLTSWWVEGVEEAAEQQAARAATVRGHLRAKYANKEATQATGRWVALQHLVDPEKHQSANVREAADKSTKQPSLVETVFKAIQERCEFTAMAPEVDLTETAVARGFGSEFGRIAERASVLEKQFTSDAAHECAAIERGDLLREVYQHFTDVDPLAERLLLSRLHLCYVDEWVREAREAVEESRSSAPNHAPADAADEWKRLQQQAAGQQGSPWNKLPWARTAHSGPRIVGEANRVRQEAIDEFNRYLSARVRLMLVESLRTFVLRRIRSYASVADVAARRAKELNTRATAYLREDNLHVDDFTLRVELFDPLDVRAHRQWDRVFDHYVWPRVAPTVANLDRVQEAFTSAYTAAEDDARRGGRSDIDPVDVLREIEASMAPLIRREVARVIQGDPDRDDLPGLDIVDALTMEAMFSLDLVSAGTVLSPGVVAPAEHAGAVESYIDRKLTAFGRRAGLLARVNSTQADESDPDRKFRFALLAGTPQNTKRLADLYPDAYHKLLADPTRTDTPQAQTIQQEAAVEWTDPRIMVLYRAMGALPAWAIEGIRDAIDGYETIMRYGDKKPHPLHTDLRWENTLPSVSKEVRAHAWRVARSLLIDGVSHGAITGSPEDGFKVDTAVVRIDLGEDPLALVQALSVALRVDPHLESALRAAIDASSRRTSKRTSVAEAIEAAVEARRGTRVDPALTEALDIAQAIRG